MVYLNVNIVVKKESILTVNDINENVNDAIVSILKGTSRALSYACFFPLILQNAIRPYFIYM